MLTSPPTLIEAILGSNDPIPLAILTDPAAEKLPPTPLLDPPAVVVLIPAFK